MPNSNHTRRAGGIVPWLQLAEPDVQQRQRFLAEGLAQLLGDLLRSIVANSNSNLAADDSMLSRYRELAIACGAGDTTHNINLSMSRTGLAKRCVAWLKLLLSAPPGDGEAPTALREFVDALALFPSLYDTDPSARSRRARLTWLLTHDRRLDASTREAAGALIDACEHLGALLWPDADAP